jgi:hypothetical protein
MVEDVAEIGEAALVPGQKDVHLISPLPKGDSGSLTSAKAGAASDCAATMSTTA